MSATDDEAAIEATKAPLLDHLLELRKRLVYCIPTFVVAFAVCFTFARQINGFLTLPLESVLKGLPNNTMIATSPTEPFFTYMKAGMFAGLCLAVPAVAAQL